MKLHNHFPLLAAFCIIVKFRMRRGHLAVRAATSIDRLGSLCALIKKLSDYESIKPKEKTIIFMFHLCFHLLVFATNSMPEFTWASTCILCLSTALDNISQLLQFIVESFVLLLLFFFIKNANVRMLSDVLFKQ